MSATTWRWPRPRGGGCAAQTWPENALHGCGEAPDGRGIDPTPATTAAQASRPPAASKALNGSGDPGVWARVCLAVVIASYATMRRSIWTMIAAVGCHRAAAAVWTRADSSSLIIAAAALSAAGPSPALTASSRALLITEGVLASGLPTARNSDVNAPQNWVLNSSNVFGGADGSAALEAEAPHPAMARTRSPRAAVRTA